MIRRSCFIINNSEFNKCLFSEPLGLKKTLNPRNRVRKFVNTIIIIDVFIITVDVRFIIYIVQLLVSTL